MTHPCPGCGDVPVPRHRLSCHPCWFRLPAALRAEINAAYRRDPDRHMDAVAEAVAWYAEHPA